MRSRGHSILMENRTKITITGVVDVDSFDESMVLLATDMGLVTLHGEDLHINKLNLEEGHLIVEGQIEALEYSDGDMFRDKSASIWGRLFR
ncbi:MAG: sporulation protein YabP [Clostridiales bacterium]|nr:sporulation protein YabP [Clostridiales bacterium]